jgi:hypothetical protein
MALKDFQYSVATVTLILTSWNKTINAKANMDKRKIKMKINVIDVLIIFSNVTM